MLRNKLRYLLCLVSVGLLSILYNKYYMTIIFFTVLLMSFILFGLLSYIYGRVKAELVSAVHIVNKGEAIPISVQLNNPTIFPISHFRVYITYRNAYSKEQFKKEFVISLDGKTKAFITFHIFSQYTGNLIITLKAIRIYDFLKIFSLKKNLKGEIRAAVMPSYYELMGNFEHHQSRLIESDTYSPYKSGDDPSEVFAIREYREGDRLQRIHWKLSRKQGQLMIKEFSDPLNCSVLLLVNLCVPSGEHVLSFLDAILESALSLSYTFLTKGQLHYFSWYDSSQGCCMRVRVAQDKDLFEAVDGLLRAVPYQETTDILTTYLAEHPNEHYSDLFYVTGEATAERLDLLSVFKAQSRQVIYINPVDQLLKNHEISSEILEQSCEMGIDLWPVNVTNVRRDMELLQRT